MNVVLSVGGCRIPEVNQPFKSFEKSSGADGCLGYAYPF